MSVNPAVVAQDLDAEAAARIDALLGPAGAEPVDLVISFVQQHLNASPGAITRLKTQISPEVQAQLLGISDLKKALGPLLTKGKNREAHTPQPSIRSDTYHGGDLGGYVKGLSQAEEIMQQRAKDPDSFFKGVLMQHKLEQLRQARQTLEQLTPDRLAAMAQQTGTRKGNEATQKLKEKGLQQEAAPQTPKVTVIFKPILALLSTFGGKREIRVETPAANGAAAKEASQTIVSSETPSRDLAALQAAANLIAGPSSRSLKLAAIVITEADRAINNANIDNLLATEVGGQTDRKVLPSQQPQPQQHDDHGMARELPHK